MAKHKPDYREGAVLEIEWLDAHSIDAWTGKDELDAKLEPELVRTIGYYQKTTRHAVVIAASVGIAGDKDVAGVWAIPKGMIRKVTVVRGE